ncbi:SPW repeat protein [Kitasatospora sp. NBC_00240]|uniref:SPW repeat domain-containing protein n=1 Tax=Kitasatospora sp. NBC_00240 TaxID=2903567 RepID=UPI00224CFA56|nr:SPW repeat protein [Kitasatospora sp. NBC_00240]MCX5216014.1 SPW repeat protein [Kitasatospora sp. NBC_00240]
MAGAYEGVEAAGVAEPELGQVHHHQRLHHLAANNLIAGIAYSLLLGALGNSYERTHSIAWAAAALGNGTCVAPWIVAHSRSSTSNLITGVITTLLTLAAASAACDRDRGTGTGTGTGTGERQNRLPMPGLDDR